MKKLFFLVILLIPVTSNALSKRSINGNDREKDCRIYSEIANNIFKKKQSGYPVSKALEDNDLSFEKNKDEDMYRVVGMIISDAYAQPSYDSATVNSKKLSEFTEKYYLGCLEMYK
ncbi:hypothetical protein [Acinetobacter bereziniae]|uniref:hypothetical protein n=1 Tax=Acinetobacter bereziniae TaxID=106648 RepID=UPI0015DAF556|nr:hypothetical protein [Acinetobacter bereziniae]